MVVLTLLLVGTMLQPVTGLCPAARVRCSAMCGVRALARSAGHRLAFHHRRARVPDASTVHTVTDIEIHFKTGEPLYFTVDEQRGDLQGDGEDRLGRWDGTKRFVLMMAPGVRRELVVERGEVRYMSCVTRPADPEEEPVTLPGGVSITGQTPVG